MDIYELENIRKSALNRILIGIIIDVCFILFLLLVCNFFHYILIIFCIFPPIILSIGKIEKFKKAYKEVIVLELFKETFTNVIYYPERGISEKIISDTNMMDMGDRFYSNDYISAKYKNVPFEFSDIQIKEEYYDRDGNKHVQTIFLGQWYIFDFNKPFKTNLQVYEKSFTNAKQGNFIDNHTFKKVSLEDINFNKRFNIYAQNELEAFYLLTPHTMEKLKELTDKIHGSIMFCFIDNRLHIGLYNQKDLFEPHLLKKINIKNNHQNIREDIMLITNFIDILNLHNDLFRKGV